MVCTRNISFVITILCICYISILQIVENIKFPETYPMGVLLGCVTVTNVLAQEEYRKLYPDGQSESPYVFICENCYTLPIPFPIKGQHKICE